jgi:putative inorganic carbon (hco3(-)) transporter
MRGNVTIPVSNEQHRKVRGRPGPFRQLFLIRHLHHPIGYLLLFVLFASVAVGIAKLGLVFAIVLSLAVFAILAVYILLGYPEIGMIMFLTLAYFLLMFLRMGVDFPLGTLMDGMEALFLINMFYQLKVRSDWKIFKGPVSTMLIVWVSYNIIEFVNPAAASRDAWLYTVRSVALIALMYFIFLYNIRSKQYVRLLIKVWLGLAFFAAIYAIKQEYFGFFAFESRYLNSDPNIAYLLFIGGTWRKFSIFSDPVVLSYTMAVSSLLCIGLLTRPLKWHKKMILLFLIVCYVAAMLYSGTRGAFVLIPAAMLLFTVLRFNRTLLIVLSITAVLLVMLINVPTSNYTLYRFQSAFKPSEDASYNVRKLNQKRIQPYILTRPIGGGLGATGEWGQRFAPNSFLANFPPDSGYVRVAVELGWVGLLIFCMMMFTILRTGINNYYAIRDPELKSYCLGMLLVVFAFNIGNFPQEALVQFPSNVNFYLASAMLVILKGMDDIQNQLPHGVK